MIIQTCCEEQDLTKYGFKKDVCMSYELVYRLTGKINYKKCNCIEIVDIGVYNCCKHFYKYCYANYDENNVIKNCKLHDKNSSLIIRKITNDDIIKIRRK